MRVLSRSQYLGADVFRFARAGSTIFGPASERLLMILRGWSVNAIASQW